MEWGDLNEKYDNALQDLKKYQEENQRLHETNENIIFNFNSLLATAKMEVKRKDRTIADLRSDKDNIVFRRPKAMQSIETQTDFSSLNLANKSTNTEPQIRDRLGHRSDYDRRTDRRDNRDYSHDDFRKNNRGDDKKNTRDDEKRNEFRQREMLSTRDRTTDRHRNEPSNKRKSRDSPIRDYSRRDKRTKTDKSPPKKIDDSKSDRNVTKPPLKSPERRKITFKESKQPPSLPDPIPVALEAALKRIRKASKSRSPDNIFDMENDVLKIAESDLELELEEELQMEDMKRSQALEKAPTLKDKPSNSNSEEAPCKAEKKFEPPMLTSFEGSLKLLDDGLFVKINATKSSVNLYSEITAEANAVNRRMEYQNSDSPPSHPQSQLQPRCESFLVNQSEPIISEYAIADKSQLIISEFSEAHKLEEQVPGTSINCKSEQPILDSSINYKSDNPIPEYPVENKLQQISKKELEMNNQNKIAQEIFTDNSTFNLTKLQIIKEFPTPNPDHNINTEKTAEMVQETSKNTTSMYENIKLKSKAVLQEPNNPEVKKLPKPNTKLTTCEKKCTRKPTEKISDSLQNTQTLIVPEAPEQEMSYKRAEITSDKPLPPTNNSLKSFTIPKLKPKETKSGEVRNKNMMDNIMSQVRHSKIVDEHKERPIKTKKTKLSYEEKSVENSKPTQMLESNLSKETICNETDDKTSEKPLQNENSENMSKLLFSKPPDIKTQPVKCPEALKSSSSAIYNLTTFLSRNSASNEYEAPNILSKDTTSIETQAANALVKISENPFQNENCEKNSKLPSSSKPSNEKSEKPLENENVEKMSKLSSSKQSDAKQNSKKRKTSSPSNILEDVLSKDSSVNEIEDKTSEKPQEKETIKKPLETDSDELKSISKAVTDKTATSQNSVPAPKIQVKCSTSKNKKSPKTAKRNNRLTDNEEKDNVSQPMDTKSPDLNGDNISPKQDNESIDTSILGNESFNKSTDSLNKSEKCMTMGNSSYNISTDKEGITVMVIKRIKKKKLKKI